jgi:hypothetical protein
MTSTNTFVLKSYKAEHVALYYNEINAYNRLKQPEIAGNIVRLYGSWKQNLQYPARVRQRRHIGRLIL